MTSLGLINVILGIASRPIWGISKIQATFSWLAICTGIGFLAFAFLLYLVDDKKKKSWAKWIAPAGTATLTCYMLPYFIYPFYAIFGWKLPAILNTGLLGLCLSMGFAMLVVSLTGIFERNGYKLKL
jgi:predicted acyltransferase